MPCSIDGIRRLLILTGPTCSGKTSIALALSQNHPIEVVSADSRQVYRGMDIGTAKPTPEQQAQVRHHLIDVIELNDTYSAYRFAHDARRVLNDVHQRGNLPLVVGGTGFYIKALTESNLLSNIGPDPQLRRDLEALYERNGLHALVTRLRKSDFRRVQDIDVRNPRRLIRAIEIAERGAVDIPVQEPSVAALVLGIEHQPSVLAERIERRTREMYARGLIDETRALLSLDVTATASALSGIGYREAAAVIEGRLTEAEAIQLTIIRTRQFARRQRTWFRHQLPVHWIAPNQVGKTASTYWGGEAECRET